MSRSGDRVPRKLAPSNPQFIFRLLSPIADASFVGEGLARVAIHSTARNGAGRGSAAGGRATSPLRTTSRLTNSPNLERAGRHLSELRSLCPNCASLHTHEPRHSACQTKASPRNCSRFAMCFGYDLRHAPNRIFARDNRSELTGYRRHRLRGARNNPIEPIAAVPQAAQ